MESVSVELLRSAAAQMQGTQRRQFLADVCLKVCDGNARQTEEQFGWGRETISRGIEEVRLIRSMQGPSRATIEAGNVARMPILN